MYLPVGTIRPKASSEVLQDRIHTVDVNLLDRLSEPACEVQDGLVFPFEDGLVFPFEDGLEGADVPFLSNRAQILRDERSP